MGQLLTLLDRGLLAVQSWHSFPVSHTLLAKDDVSLNGKV